MALLSNYLVVEVSMSEIDDEELKVRRVNLEERYRQYQHWQVNTEDINSDQIAHSAASGKMTGGRSVSSMNDKNAKTARISNLFAQAH